MQNVLFLQSEVKDPYAIYEAMRTEDAVHYDAVNRIWAIYRYEDCVAVLNSSHAYVPFPAVSRNQKISTVTQNLVRLSNPPEHTKAREAVFKLMMYLKACDISDLLHSLIGEPKRPAEIDWVSDVSTKLPVLALAKGFGFSPAEIQLIVEHMNVLVTIMLPARTEEQNILLEQTLESIFDLIKARISDIFKEDTEENRSLCSVNLLGIFIQSYDAGRGLLSNTLLRLIVHPEDAEVSRNYFEKLAKETLRFDPAVQNTRRVLKTETRIRNKILKAGEHILIVLASANRDPDQFSHPSVFDLHRRETPQYLTYGTGIHQCVAEHWSINLTVSAIHYLYSKYKMVMLSEPEIRYEPRVNVRLPVRMRILIS